LFQILARSLSSTLQAVSNSCPRSLSHDLANVQALPKGMPQAGDLVPSSGGRVRRRAIFEEGASGDQEEPEHDSDAEESDSDGEPGSSDGGSDDEDEEEEEEEGMSHLLSAHQHSLCVHDSE
jgi:hypothetical protein